MSGSEIRRTMALFPISIVMQLTDLTARQIRYYEEHGLITPARTEGNRRLFSLNDIDKLLEVKDLLDQGVNMAGIKKIFSVNAVDEKKVVSETSKQEEGKARQDLSDEQLRKLLRNELMHSGKFNRASLRQGDMSRFFHVELNKTAPKRTNQSKSDAAGSERKSGREKRGETDAKKVCFVAASIFDLFLDGFSR